MHFSELEVKKFEVSCSCGLSPYILQAYLSISFIRFKWFDIQSAEWAIALKLISFLAVVRKLTEEPYVGRIDWTRWHVFWADERVVPLEHPERNYKLAYDGLFFFRFFFS